MAVALSEVASVTITSESAAVTQAGFGVPLILSANAAFSERVRTYSTLTALSADFASSTVEYQAVTEMFSQSPRPPVVRIGRLTNKPTQKFTLTPVAVHSATYAFKVRKASGSLQTVTYTADSGTTATEICDGLRTAYAALSPVITGLTATGTATLILTADTAGAWFAIESTNSPVENLLVVQDHNTSDISGSLDAILLENADFYSVHHLYNSYEDLIEIATWVQSNNKVAVLSTSDTAVSTLALGSDTTTVAYSLKNSARTRAMLLYHENSGAFLDCALAGMCLPKTPGTETWMGKQLTLTEGASNLTGTQVTNLKAKHAGYFTECGGINITFQGKVSSGAYLDNTRLQDWVVSRIQEGIVAVIAANDKIPYTDQGINLIYTVVDSVLDEGVTNGGIAAGYTVTVPKVADVSDADKTSRTLNNVAFSYTATGAIHSVNVSGTASV